MDHLANASLSYHSVDLISFMSFSIYKHNNMALLADVPLFYAVDLIQFKYVVKQKIWKVWK